MAARNKMPEENFFDALELLSRERGIPVEELKERIRKAIESAVKKDYDVDEEHIRVEMDTEKGKFGVVIIKEVVEAFPEADDEGLEPEPDTRHLILLSDAVKVKKTAKVGQMLDIPLKTKEFGRIAAQTAKHVIRQGLRDAERNQMYTEMQSKSHEILPAIVNNVDEKRGLVSLSIGRNEAILPKNEQVPGEVLLEGQRIKVYVVDVLATERGPKIMISRTHPGLVKRIFEMEVPEIYDGTVEVKAISREAGARTKMAVWSKNPEVDPVGACIGPKGSRVATIVEELNGEKIDIVRYSEDPVEFISAALSPASVVKVEILDSEKKSCRVTVPDHQLSLAIGNKGQNARLTARLTGYNIDIRPESGYYGEEPEANA
ncbi:MAG: transcription termination/antitermination protein NusA [Oscillospiraceae bacterium]|nr:transcription termination/antitermination protein NusA [Oscillospiraceae bacterium]